MTDPAPQPFKCNACDQVDTDPMIHVSHAVWEKDEQTTIKEPSFHFDCLPQEYRAEISGPQNAVTVAAIEAAESGVKGQDLREFIQSLPDDNNLEG